MRALSQIVASFAYQSYFDSTLLGKAILTQPTNEPIVTSTKKTSQGGGYSIGLAGYSDCPVAVRFFGGELDSGVIVLRPGQIVRPGKFVAFDYGLPFGWLGGGKSVLIVGHDKDVTLDLGPTRQDMIFHRVRVKIEASAGALPALVRNWPLSFPWTQAVNGANSIDQRGVPILRVNPSRVLMRLRVAISVEVAVPMVFRSSRDLDESSTATYTAADLESTAGDVIFRPVTNVALALYPSALMPDPFYRIACDEGGLSLLDNADASLTNQFVDIVRYGSLA